MEKKVFGYNSETGSWHCTSCGEDMGEHNPRQLCRKYYCPNPYYFTSSPKRKPLDIITSPEKKTCKTSISKSPSERDKAQYEEDCAWDKYIEEMSAAEENYCSDPDEKDPSDNNSDDELSHHSEKDPLHDR